MAFRKLVGSYKDYNLSTHILEDGYLAVDVDTGSLRLGDGTTSGGTVINTGGGGGSSSSLGDLSAIGSTLTAPSNADFNITTAGTGNIVLNDLSISDNTLSTNRSNDDLHINASGTGTVVLENLKIGSSGSTVTTILDEDNMSSNSATSLATQQSIKAYVDGEVSGLSQTSISQGDSNVTVVDSGTGNVTIEVDGTDRLTTVAATTTTATGHSLVIGAGSNSAGGQIKFLEGTDNGTNGVTLLGPASTADVTVTLPAATDTLVGKATTDTFTNKTIDANGTGNSITNLEVADLASGVLDTDISSVSGSDDTIASAKAIKTYVDAQIATKDNSDEITEGSTNLYFTNARADARITNALKDEDNMASDSATHVPSQQSVKAYVDAGDLSLIDEDNFSTDSASRPPSQQSVKAYVDAQDAAIASDTLTLTNKTIDANGTGNSISNIDIGNMTAAVVVTESEGISSNDNDTTLPTSAAVRDYADTKAVLTGSTNNQITTVTGAHAIQGESNLTFDGSTLAVTGAVTVSGDLTVSGDTTTVSTTNTAISDNILELNTGISQSFNDAGIIIERGSTGNNAAIIWDESADKFTMGTTTATAADKSGGITVTKGTLLANIEGNVTGNADTATALATARNIAGQSFDGTAAITIASTDLSNTSAIALLTASQTLTNKTLTNPTINAATMTGAVAIDGVTITDNTVSANASNSALQLASSGTGDIDLNAGADVNIPANIGLTFGDDGEKIEGNGTLLTISSSNNIVFDANNDILLDSGAGAWYFNDDGTTIGSLTNSSSDFVLKSNVSDKDLIFKGNDGGSGITALTLDMSAAGDATFNSNIFLGDNKKANFGAGNDLQIYHDGSQSIIEDAGTGQLKILAENTLYLGSATGSEKYISAIKNGAVDLSYNNSVKLETTNTGIAVTGAVTVSGDLTVSGNTTTVSTTNTTIADNIIELNTGISQSLNDAGIIIERGSTGNNAAIIWDESADTFVLGTTTATAADKSSGITIDAGSLKVASLEADGVTITDNVITSNSSNANLDINANGSGTVVLENLSVAGDGATVTGILDEDDMSSDSNVKLATQQSIKAYADTKATLSGSTDNTIATVTGAHALQGEANLTFDGSTFAVTGGATISTTLGVTGASTLDGVTISDNKVSANASNSVLQLASSGTGDVEVDAGGDIILDADNADVILKDAGVEFGRFSRVSSDLVIKSATSNKDIVFKGNDGGATITALTLDMSEAGTATFNDKIVLGTNKAIEFVDTNESIQSDGSKMIIKSGGTTFNLPTADGNAGDVLKTDGAGTLSFSSSAATASDDTRVVTKNNKSVSASPRTVDYFQSTSADLAWYFVALNDLTNDHSSSSCFAVAHNNSDAFVSPARGGSSGSSNSLPTTSADISSGQVRVKIAAPSADSKISYYKIPISRANTADATAGVTITTSNTDVDSASESIDTFAHASFRAAKYLILVDDNAKTETGVTEALVVHDGTNAFVSQYGTINTGNNDMITLSAAISGDNVVLSAAGLTPNLSLKIHKTLLSDSMSAVSNNNQTIIGATTVSSSATALDNFDLDDATAAVYYVVGKNATEGAFSVQEVYCSGAPGEASVSQGPFVSTKATTQLEFTAAFKSDADNSVELSVASTSGGSTVVNAYRINCLAE